VVAVPPLLYERNEDGTFRPLGSPEEVWLEEVTTRVHRVVEARWCTFKKVWQALGRWP
jgi:hypothetical protein